MDQLEERPASNPRPLTTSSADGRGLALIHLAGFFYLAAAFLRGPLVERFFDVVGGGATAVIEHHALELQLVSLASLLPTIFLLCMEALLPGSLLRRSFGIQGRSFARGFAVATL